MPSLLSPGRALITLSNLVYSIGAFVADYNETHVKNPRWPPHAKFHNGQTMTLGLLLSATSMYFLLRDGDERRNVGYAAWVGSLYCLAGMSAILYPGTAWQDPEFKQTGEQKFVFGGICLGMLVGYLLEMRRLGKMKGA